MTSLLGLDHPSRVAGVHTTSVIVRGADAVLPDGKPAPTSRVETEFNVREAQSGNGKVPMRSSRRRGRSA